MRGFRLNFVVFPLPSDELILQPQPPLLSLHRLTAHFVDRSVQLREGKDAGVAETRDVERSFLMPLPHHYL